jgi:exopolyphosphatase/guanosine-5'-triphosphate,3'-diphosphate pyrophosphatase
MGEDPFGLLELGSNSLKFYLVRTAAGGEPSVRTWKFPHRVAHDVFTAGKLEEPTALALIESLRSIEALTRGVRLSQMLALATGVFREIEEIEDLAARVKAETGIRIRVISGEDEAILMARSFCMDRAAGPTLLCDIGGATTQWAVVLGGKPAGFGTLPLGAIRNEYRFRHLRKDLEAYLRECAGHCDSLLAGVEVPSGASVRPTGGTARAAVRVLGESRIPREALARLIARSMGGERFPDLKPEREAVLLPGLIVLERILERCGTGTFELAPASVGNGMAERLLRLLATHPRSDLHATLLLETRTPRPRAGSP